MSANDLLSQEEIDALLHGVDNGDVATETDVVESGGVNAYDFTSQDRIVRGRLPTLEMINERFARLFRTSLFNMLRRTADLSVSGIQMQKFSEFVHSLFVPTSLNMIRVPPLRGKGLFVIDPKLVFSVVDNYFGGSGRFHTKIEGRDFTPTENRVIQLLLKRAFEDLVVAWKPVFKVKFEYSGSEVNPQFANIVSPSEVVVVTSFHVDLESGGGDFHVCMPYSMLEPIRELLDAGVQSDRGERDERWERSLKEEIMSAKIELSSSLTEVQMSLKELAELKAGDVIPIDMPEEVEVEASDIPVFKAKLGVSDGNYALKINKWILRNRSKGLHDYLEMEKKAAEAAASET
ncbi:MAG: flagellar motor switch protein FliM [Candidatus Thiodiazotropha sp.]|nr:flagellar motor switch protein FliM [Candidatus Thiodiazotropha taylori]MBT3061666.1 flagellar motor switch protein FliM [Candidatus Thiodiazotropha sp. (ex Lucina pensylvanica)]MBV2097108.1 flagellar motor switch protein FliM [Candidatus Thiodiazotropha sp. (ex Codakia orbicularis)]PUB76069.1 MAG: flagellar motor switch protein FliM [gamma proteobacterium symbiont of Ctena orbiculata]PUB78788.1 MAG: flagellar motor switch protein FliM [gamma proteobacterium symbiont of Ctena orbiculata]